MNLLKTISSAIDTPLMDVENISLLISEYLHYTIFYLEYAHEIEHQSSRYILKGCFLARNKEHAWDLYKAYYGKNKKHIEYKIKKNEFLSGLSEGGIYIKTKGTINHVALSFIDDRDEYNEILYEYKKPTKNVIRKQIIQRAVRHNLWYLPMVDIMFDGVEYNPVSTLLKLSH
jgi:hypothetical protein